ncbi:hypothetical protein GCM10028824_32880 [Hymenobacter segetis]|uniref:Secreted protein n=1 Tax=Hymenobacter segetis TaxID=2025509 RepID=A0ABU9LYI5_9BACT
MFDFFAIALFQLATVFGYAPTDQLNANESTSSVIAADGTVGSGGWGNDVTCNDTTVGSGGWGNDVIGK